MDFTALRYFGETARAKSIRGASERLHVSPSAISRQIAKLEHELRAQIFERRAKGMVLTPAGEILATNFEAMMRELERVKSHIAALQNLQAGTVDICCFQTAIESFIAPVIEQFHRQYPNVVFNVRMCSTDEAMEALMTGAAEIGLIVDPPPREAIVSLEVFRDNVVAALSPRHPLASLPIMTVHDLAAYPIVLTERSFGLRQYIDRVFDRHGINPRICCVTNSLLLVKEVASIGSQTTLLPEFAVLPERASGRLTTVPVKEFADNPLVFAISTHRDRAISPAAQAFSAAVMLYCERYRRN